MNFTELRNERATKEHEASTAVTLPSSSLLAAPKNQPKHRPRQGCNPQKEVLNRRFSFSFERIRTRETCSSEASGSRSSHPKSFWVRPDVQLFASLGGLNRSPPKVVSKGNQRKKHPFCRGGGPNRNQAHLDTPAAARLGDGFKRKLLLSD